MNELLELVVEQNASDLHCQVGLPPTLRMSGSMVPIEGPNLTPEMTEQLMLSITPDHHQQTAKLEGGADQAEVIAGLVSAGIPVMAHVGLRPQSVHQLGGYRVQRDRSQLLEDAQAAQDAGAFAVVLECIPQQLAAEISHSLRIPTIGIGAGHECDGQILVFHDLLGLTQGRLPKHVKKYAELGETIRSAVTSYCKDVRTGQFPSSEHSFD